MVTLTGTTHDKAGREHTLRQRFDIGKAFARIPTEHLCQEVERRIRRRADWMTWLGSVVTLTDPFARTVLFVFDLHSARVLMHTPSEKAQDSGSVIEQTCAAEVEMGRLNLNLKPEPGWQYCMGIEFMGRVAAGAEYWSGIENAWTQSVAAGCAASKAGVLYLYRYPIPAETDVPAKELTCPSTWTGAARKLRAADTNKDTEQLLRSFCRQRFGVQV